MTELYTYRTSLWIRVLEYDRDEYLAPFYMDQSVGVWQSCILATLIYGSDCWRMTELYTYHPSLWIRVLQYDRVVYLAPLFMDQSSGVWHSCILTTLLYGSECWSMIELCTYHTKWWIRVLEYDRVIYLPRFFMDLSVGVWQSCILTTLLYGSECWSMTELYTYHLSLWIRVLEHERVVDLPPFLWIRVLENDRVVYLPPFFMDLSVGVWHSCILTTLLFGSECWSMT